MSSHFFTNEDNNTLHDKFIGVFEHMSNMEYFKSVTGYFRASGYFEIQKHFPKDLKVKIIAGINVDTLIKSAQTQGLLFNPNEKDVKSEFFSSVKEYISKSPYSKAFEEDIKQLIEDIVSKRTEIRAHNSKRLHSKFYIFLPQNFNKHSDGSVIMGSSNLSAQGLGLEDVKYNYEMNILLKSFDDVDFANHEFEKLWKESSEILPADAPTLIKETYLDITPTPFEMYVKFLIEYFGNNIDYDPNSIGDIPSDKFKKLSYQVDAVNHGYELLLKHNGFFLADVVGTGKTIMSAMLAKKFIIENGSKTRILVVYPPALKDNWESTFKDFKIQNSCDFITNGSLNKIIDGKFVNEKEAYDLILIDEAHKFRNHTSTQFKNLQIICKAGRENIGGVDGFEKKVVLISATPLNNRPEDLYYQLSLFQDTRRSNLGIRNLQNFFAPKIKKYKELIKNKPIDIDGVKEIFTDIRDKIIKDITIRRTRTDLAGNERYKNDLIENEIRFPTVAQPVANKYELSKDIAKLFDETTNTIISNIGYFRYQAIAYLTKEANNGIYQNAETISLSLASIMKTLLVKRLESSFEAFKISLNKITNSTKYMIDMYEKDTIFIAPDLDITKLIDEGLDDGQIEERILGLQENNPKNRIFQKSDFTDGFIDGLKKDFDYLKVLNDKWQSVKEEDDPKWKVFVGLMNSTYFDKTTNTSGKLVIFTESADTLNYVSKRLKNETSYKVLSITSENRSKKFMTIRENFDANYTGILKDDYQIILTTDVLAEGINLHRANVIVNYDTPWNPTKLIQRLGRINRIGTKAKNIYNYNFYPSSQGDKSIGLFQKSLVKLQSSHTTFGEDNKIYTLDEIIEQFDMFIENKEDKDIRTEKKEWLRKFKEDHPKEFKTISDMPQKVRCIRKSDTIKSIAFVKNGEYKNIYLYDNDNKSYPVVFEKAVKIFEATQNEKGLLPIPEIHYEHINNILTQFEMDSLTNSEEMPISVENKPDSRTNTVIKKLNDWLGLFEEDKDTQDVIIKLLPMVKDGAIIDLTNRIYKLTKETDLIKIQNEITILQNRFVSKLKRPKEADFATQERSIIISETFTKGNQ